MNTRPIEHSLERVRRAIADAVAIAVDHVYSIGMAPFNGFDFSRFWAESAYARKSYVDKPLTEPMIADVEAELGVRLPASYIELMKSQNGGIPRNCCFPTNVPTSWADDHVAISGIAGIGRSKPHSLCGKLGSKFMQAEWGYPEIGICICDCPSAGHDMVMLDYRECGPDGEPRVVHVDQESDYRITPLAKDFESFIRGLVHESVFDANDNLEQDLVRVDRGAFSSPLVELLAAAEGARFGPILRAVCRRLTLEKGHFTLHDDRLSLLVYDLLFLLYTRAKVVRSEQEYLKVYPQMIVFGDGAFSTGGYAPSFVKDWLKARRSSGGIVEGSDGTLAFTEEAVARLMGELRVFDEPE